MLRQATIYLALTILLVVFARVVHILIFYINYFYKFAYDFLLPYFQLNLGFLGPVLLKVLILVGLPILVAAIIACLYLLIKKSGFPYFFSLTWGLWLVFVLSTILKV